VIFGAAYDESLGDQLRVTVIATGLSGATRRQQAPITLVQAAPAVMQPVLRTGTDNIPILGSSMAMSPAAGQPAQPMQADYSSRETPSVWRSARTKVETLASSGMDEIEIPAFLRKQAD
jgi:cell division protein FtsZ